MQLQLYFSDNNRFNTSPYNLSAFFLENRRQLGMTSSTCGGFSCSRQKLGTSSGDTHTTKLPPFTKTHLTHLAAHSLLVHCICHPACASPQWRSLLKACVCSLFCLTDADLREGEVGGGCVCAVANGL